MYEYTRPPPSSISIASKVGLFVFFSPKAHPCSRILIQIMSPVQVSGVMDSPSAVIGYLKVLVDASAVCW